LMTILENEDGGRRLVFSRRWVRLFAGLAGLGLLWLCWPGALTRIQVMFAVARIVFLRHRIAIPLQITPAKLVLSALRCLLLGRRDIRRSRRRSVRHHIRIGWRRITAICVVAVKNRHRDKHRLVKPGVPELPERTVDAEGW